MELLLEKYWELFRDYGVLVKSTEVARTAQPPPRSTSLRAGSNPRLERGGIGTAISVREMRNLLPPFPGEGWGEVIPDI
jgi:hypothetical protein